MKILICFAETKEYISDTSFVQAFKDIGHEVATCGCKIGNYAEDGELKGTKDIKVYDKRQHPETYTYQEILKLYKAKYKCRPDLILQTDPHFYFIGDKLPDIKSAYYILDAHRGADVFRRMAKQGNFNYIFIAHKYFMPLFQHQGLNCYYLPCGYNDNFIKEYPEIEQQCDVVFIGENGLSDELNTYNAYDSELGVKYHEGEYPLIPHERRYRSWENRSMEYAERAEILTRLSRDFNLRVYKAWDNSEGANYAKIINRGKIVVNHSVWMDLAYRNLEVLGCNRFLISDMLPYQEDIIKDTIHYRSYRKYFLPFLSNFDLEYEEIKRHVGWYLRYERLRRNVAKAGCDYVKANHTLKHRAQKIIDIVFG